MKRLIYGLAALQLLAGAAMAQQPMASHPMQLTNEQMDKVTARVLETDMSDTSTTVVSIFQRPYLTDSAPNGIA